VLDGNVDVPRRLAADRDEARKSYARSQALESAALSRRT
jgi:hypothetical protein